MTAPPPIPPPLPRKKSKSTLWIILAAIFVAGIGGIGIFAAILIPTVGKVRETARRTVDASNLRQIVQAALISSNDHNGMLPPVCISSDGVPDESDLATIHAVAALLARSGGLYDVGMWFSGSDQRGKVSREAMNSSVSILDPISKNVRPEFANIDVFAWDFATGLSTEMQPTTPVAWTRGLRTDGTWDPKNGVFGGDGGHVVFLGGNVQFFRELNGNPLIAPDGSSTSNILEALPIGTRVVGSGPGTLHGEIGHGGQP
jgi:hypothetical protein